MLAHQDATARRVKKAVLEANVRADRGTAVFRATTILGPRGRRSEIGSHIGKAIVVVVGQAPAWRTTADENIPPC
jgi:hypothetical protein